MATIKLETGCGEHFTNVSKQAKEMASNGDTVEFEFNGVICIVTKDTNLDWLYNDYCNAHTMEWERVTGVGKYSAKVKKELERRRKKAEQREKEEQLAYKKKDKEERTLFEAKTKGIDIQLKDAELWKEYVEKNSDPYGKCAVDYAEGWAKLMQVEMANGKSLIDCAEKTSFELGFYGITGFMYGCAVQMLSKCWEHGEELRKWHNKEYDHEGEGVVNPAILTLTCTE